jgi:choline dehydrogenase-like flavoprotein
VIVVGSGASAAGRRKRLARPGVKVALLDAGRARSPTADYKEHVPAFALQYRNQAPDVIRKTRPVQKDCYACTEWNYDWFRNDLEEPYTTAAGKPFSVAGPHAGGGRAHERVGPAELPASRSSTSRPRRYDGFGEDWPLSYDDVAPYYDIVEDYVGITGIAEGVYELPDGKFHPPMGMRCVERHVRASVKKKLGWTVTLGRAANITKPIKDRQPCHYCGPCERGLRDQVVLQLRVHDRGRRARVRQLHARAERDGSTRS